MSEEHKMSHQWSFVAAICCTLLASGCAYDESGESTGVDFASPWMWFIYVPLVLISLYLKIKYGRETDNDHDSHDDFD